MADENASLPNMEMMMVGAEGTAALVGKDNEIDSVPTTIRDDDLESECSSRSEEDVTRAALEVEADAFTRFIERQRIEVMYELRRIRLGERPVTGQPNRERIETFLNNIQQQQHEEEARVPSTRPIQPSAHIEDIDALSNRRCVSAALSSAAFRQDLESAIRRSVQAAPAVRVQPVPTVRIQPAPVVPAQAIPQAPPIRRAPTPVVVEPQQPVQVVAEIPAPLNVERQERELQAWDAITQLQREIIVIEISDLVHRQLVSSALESDFRTHLEQNVLSRMARGALPQAEVRAAPVPVAAHPRAAAATTTNMTSSGVAALETRLDSMQQMLQMMFTMQMDMQRSLRQEVASAFAHSQSMIPMHSSQPVDAGHCSVCLTATSDTVLYRCGHLCVCYMCGLRLKQTGSTVKCPVCRAPVDDIVRVYRSSNNNNNSNQNEQ